MRHTDPSMVIDHTLVACGGQASSERHCPKLLQGLPPSSGLCCIAMALACSRCSLGAAPRVEACTTSTALHNSPLGYAGVEVLLLGNIFENMSSL